MKKLIRSYERILEEDIKRSGLTREEVVSLYEEAVALCDLLADATEKEKLWIKEDFERINFLLNR